MSTQDILTAVGGIMLAVIGYFLKKTMEDLRDVKLLSYNTKSELDILRNDHTNKYANLTEKLDGLKSSLQELTIEIKELNKRLK